MLIRKSAKKASRMIQREKEMMMKKKSDKKVGAKDTIKSMMNRCRNIKLGMTPDGIEGMYTEAHAAIRVDPSAKAEVAVAKHPGNPTAKIPRRVVPKFPRNANKKKKSTKKVTKKSSRTIQKEKGIVLMKKNAKKYRLQRAAQRDP